MHIDGEMAASCRHDVLVIRYPDLVNAPEGLQQHICWLIPRCSAITKITYITRMFWRIAPLHAHTDSLPEWMFSMAIWNP